MKYYRAISEKVYNWKCKNAPVIILWMTLFLVQALLFVVVILVAKTGCTDLESINRSFEPDFAPSFIVGPRDLLYGEFISDKDESDSAVLLDVMRVAIFSKICDTVKNSQTDLFKITNSVQGLNYESNSTVTFNFNYPEGQKSGGFCNSFREFKTCENFDEGKLTFRFIGSPKSVNSIVEVKSLLNGTRIPVIIKFPAIPRTVFLNSKCLDAGIKTPPNDYDGIFQYTDQYSAYSHSNETITAIIVGWNDDTMTSLIDGEQMQGGFIARVVGENDTPRHSVDWWIGNVSLDTETRKCSNPNSFLYWNCWNKAGGMKDDFTPVNFTDSSFDKENLDAFNCSNIQIVIQRYNTNDDGTIEKTTLYELLTKHKQQMKESSFVPLCKRNNVWNEFNMTHLEGNYFDIELEELNTEDVYLFKHVWKELLETYFTPCLYGRYCNKVECNSKRSECAYSFIPYSLITHYMQIDHTKTNFTAFNITNIECSKDNVEQTTDYNVNLELSKRDFDVLQNDVVYGMFSNLVAQQNNNQKEEL